MKTVITDCRRRFAKLYAEQQLDGNLSAFEYVKSLEQEDGLTGDENDFHNFATELARADYYEAACEVLKQGVIAYPTNTDLLADYILYAHKCGKHEVAREKFRQLKEIDRVDWTWRGYVFSIDYHIELLKGQKGDERKTTQSIIEVLIEEFKQNLRSDEKAYLAQFDYLEAIGKREDALETLKNILDNGVLKVCTQCCLRYVDRCLEKGDYNAAAIYAKKGIAMTEEQESAESTAFWYFWALSEDHKWCNENLSADDPDKASARYVIKLYDTVLNLDPNARYKAACGKRKKMIASFAGIELPKEEKQPDMSQLLQMLKQAQG